MKRLVLLKSIVIALCLVFLISCSNGQTQNGDDSGNTTYNNQQGDNQNNNQQNNNQQGDNQNNNQQGDNQNNNQNNNNQDDNNSDNKDDTYDPLDFDAKTEGLTVYQSSNDSVFAACIPEGFIIKRIEKPGYNAHIRIHVSSPNSQKTLIIADLKPDEYVYIYKFTEKNHYYNIKVEVFNENWAQAILGQINNLKATGGVGEWYMYNTQLSFFQKNVLFNCSFQTPNDVSNSIKSKESYLGIWPRGYASAGSDQFSITKQGIQTSFDISADYNKVKNTKAAVELQYVYYLKDDTAYLFSYYDNYYFQ